MKNVHLDILYKSVLLIQEKKVKIIIIRLRQMSSKWRLVGTFALVLSLLSIVTRPQPWTDSFLLNNFNKQLEISRLFFFLEQVSACTLPSGNTRR